MIAYVLLPVLGGVVGFLISKLVFRSQSTVLDTFVSMFIGFMVILLITGILPRETYLVNSREITPELVTADKLPFEWHNIKKDAIVILFNDRDRTLNLVVIDKADAGIIHNSNIKSHEKEVVCIEKHKSRVRNGHWYSVIFPKDERVETTLFYPKESFAYSIRVEGKTREIAMLRTPADG